MKGLDLLADTCKPVEPEPSESTGMQLTDEQIDMIADRMIAKLQNKAPEPAAAESSDDVPDPEPETGGEDFDD